MGKRLTTEEFIERARKVHGDRYDYSRVKYKGARKKVEIICSDHGSFWQIPGNHLNGNGCPKCAGVYKLTTEEFIERARKVHGDRYDYSRVEYERSDKKVEMICSDHGSFWQTPAKHLKGQKCPKCQKCAGKYKFTTEEFIKRARKVHGDRYDYSRVEYERSDKKVEIICHDHGSFWQTPGNHVSMKQGCPKCALKNKTLTLDEFIKRARKIHGDIYDYSRVVYKSIFKKIEIICPIHGSFWQTPDNHLHGRGCSKCSGRYIPTTGEFIEMARKIHGDKYDYSRAVYKGLHKKLEIICKIHGSFLQTPGNHLKGCGCPKCAGLYKEKYAKNNIPVYDRYKQMLSPYGVECRRNKDDENVLEVKCMYCDRWYIPDLQSVQRKIRSINGDKPGEQNLYCSNNCKKACPTFNQKKYPKGFKTNTSREVQPALRKLVLKRDNYTCQKCGATDTELHCHHYEGIKVNPVESADMDNCITLCKKCHNEVHTKEKCGMKDYRC